MWMLIAKGVIAGATVIGVSLLAEHYPRTGALLLTLPLVSILVFISARLGGAGIEDTSRLARETLILVPLGLPFFVPLAFAGLLGINFWSSFGLGLLFAAVTIGLWFWLGPENI